MTIRNKIAFLRRREEFESGLGEEIRFHLEERTDELVAAGWEREAARRKARIEFGSVSAVAEDARREWQFSWIEDALADLRYAWRGLRREPGFLAAAVVSLALGIGVNTAVFSLTMEMLASQPSARDADQLLMVRLGGASHMSQQAVRFVRDLGVFPGVAGQREEGELNWRNGETTQKLFVIRVTDNLFGMAGIPVLLGRGIAPGDQDAVVVAHRFWQGKLGGDPGIVGRTLVLDGRPHTVVGVLPEDHRTLVGLGLMPDLYAPVRDATTSLALYVRMPEGVSEATARQRLAAIAAEMDKSLPNRDFPYARSVRVNRVSGLSRMAEARGVSLFFGMLMAVVTLLLGIACLNVSGLLLARASSRKQEFAIRVSLGAGRGRLLRQLLTESLLLATAGTAAGLALHLGLTRLLSRVPLPLPIPVMLRLEPDWRLFAYAAGIAVICTVGAGLLPAWRASREAMGREDHQVSGRQGLRRLVVVAQVAASIVVLVTAVLFARNLTESIAMHPGFDLDRTLYVSLRVVPERYADVARKRSFIEGLAGQLAAVPGVESVAATATIPLNDDVTNGGELRTDLSAEPKRIPHHFNRVGPGYFRTLGVAVLGGREFQRGEDGVVIVNESFARAAFGGESPVGHTLRFGARELRIVGMVRDSKYAWLGDHDRPAVFEPYGAETSGYRSEMVQFMVRARTDPDGLTRPLQSVAMAFDSSAAVEVKPMARATGMALLPSRIGAGLLGLMGVLGLALTGVGLYGLLSYSVARRVREIGLRMALGAAPGQIRAMVFSEGGRLLGVGMAIGLGVAYFVTRPLAQFLVPGLSTSDPLTYATVVVVLLCTGAAACAIPARRALGVEPMEALRNS